MIAAGIFLCFFGNSFINIVFGATITFVVCLFTQLFVYLCMGETESVNKVGVQWTIFILSILVGATVGCLCVKFRSFSLAVLSGVGGGFLGSLINTSFMISNEGLYWGIMSVCIALTMMFTYYTQETIIILLTSFIGSYAMCKGVSYLFGGFWNDKDLYEHIVDGSITWSTFPKIFYLFAVVVFVIAAIGCKVQMVKAKKMKANQDKEENETSKKELKAYRDKKIKQQEKDEASGVKISKAGKGGNDMI